MLFAWFIIAFTFLAVGWIFEKVVRREFSFKGEVLILAAIAVVEVYAWQIGIEKEVALNWTHVFYTTIPSFALAVLLT
jgi:hypothetical protein